MDTSNLLQEIFNEAVNGKIHVTNDCYFCHFYTRMEGVSNAKDARYPLLDIANYNEFLIQIEKYINIASLHYKDDKDFFCFDDYSYKKMLLIGLFTNMTRYDFTDPINYIINNINMLLSLNEKDIKLGNFLDYSLHGLIRKNSFNFESPYSFILYFKDKTDNKFILPAINFGISDDKLYLFSVQQIFSCKQDNIISKKLDRYFRKINKDVDTKDDIFNISPNALVSLTIFLSWVKNNLNVKEVIANNYMPIRYDNSKVFKYVFSKENKKEILKKHDIIQFNITNKFMNLLNRYSYHFKNDIYYDDIKDEMHMLLNETLGYNNIIYEIYNINNKFKR